MDRVPPIAMEFQIFQKSVLPVKITKIGLDVELCSG